MVEDHACKYVEPLNIPMRISTHGKRQDCLTYQFIVKPQASVSPDDEMLLISIVNLNPAQALVKINLLLE